MNFHLLLRFRREHDGHIRAGDKGASVKKVFISYRRDDSRWVSGRIYDALAARYGAANVFKDVYTIPLGVDFRTYLDTQVSQCDVMLVVIGSQWLSVTDEAGRRRLDDPADFTRVEIEQALQRAIPVIPVLVDGTRMPHANELPESLAPLAFRNATTVRDADFPTDMERLVTSVEAINVTGLAHPSEQGRRVSEGSSAAGAEADAIAVSSTSRWRFGVRTCLLGSVVVLVALVLPWRYARYLGVHFLISNYPGVRYLVVFLQPGQSIVMWLTLLTAGVTLYISRSLLQRPSSQRQGLDRFLWRVPAVTGTRALFVATIIAIGVMAFGYLVFSSSPLYFIAIFYGYAPGESLATVGSLLSLVGALVALRAPRRQGKVAT